MVKVIPSGFYQGQIKPSQFRQSKRPARNGAGSSISGRFVEEDGHRSNEGPEAVDLHQRARTRERAAKKPIHPPFLTRTSRARSSSSGSGGKHMVGRRTFQRGRQVTISPEAARRLPPWSDTQIRLQPALILSLILDLPFRSATKRHQLLFVHDVVAGFPRYLGRWQRRDRHSRADRQS